MKPEKIHSAIGEGVTGFLKGIAVHGIDDAAVRSLGISEDQLDHLVTHLATHGRSEIRLSVEVDLFLRISNADVLQTPDNADFLLLLTADGDEVRATAINEEDWSVFWERGMESIKQVSLEAMREDIWRIDANLSEDSYTFQAAMVLRTSELVGPYSCRIATFLGYSPDFVHVIAAHLQEAKIWESDEVRSERWFDPGKGAINFLLDLMVAEGKLVHCWSEEKNDFTYCKVEVQPCSRLTV